MNDKTKVLGPITVVVGFLVLAVCLVNAPFIPVRYRFIIFVVTVMVSMFVMLLTQRPFWRYLTTICIILVSLGLLFSQYYVNRIASRKQYEIASYQLIKTSDIALNAASKIGVFGIHKENYSKMAEGLNADFSPKSIETYETVEDAVADLQTGNLKGLVLNGAFMSLVTDQFLDNPDEVIMVKAYEFKRERDLPAKSVDVTSDPFIIYASGIDIYGDVVTQSRSDMNMLIVVNPQSHEMLLINIPRDSYFPLGCEEGQMDKLTHAGLYGVGCSINTLENAFKIDINYYVRVNFSGLVRIVDELGGVDVVSLHDFETAGRDRFVKGINHVDGRKALVFARERNHIEYGDVSRGLHHQELIKAILDKMISPESLMRAPQISAMLNESIDTNLDDVSISKLIAQQVEKGYRWHYQDINLKGKGDMQPVYSLDDKYKYYIYWPERESVKEIQNAIIELVTKEVNHD